MSPEDLPAPAAAAHRNGHARLRGMLIRLVERKGSDLLLVAGAAPTIMVDGRASALDEPVLNGPAIEQIVLPALSRHAQAQEITITRKNGSFTMEESLADLVKRAQISRADALFRAGHQEELEHTLGAMGL